MGSIPIARLARSDAVFWFGRADFRAPGGRPASRTRPQEPHVPRTPGSLVARPVCVWLLPVEPPASYATRAALSRSYSGYDLSMRDLRPAQGEPFTVTRTCTRKTLESNISWTDARIAQATGNPVLDLLGRDTIPGRRSCSGAGT